MNGRPFGKHTKIGQQYHREYNNKNIYFHLGIGCKNHDNCFTCPFHDCTFDVTHDMKGHRIGNDIDIGTKYLD